MGNRIANKKCKQCGKEMINVISNKLFCDECNHEKIRKNRVRQNELLKQKKLENKEQILKDNFYKFNDNFENYILCNFNNISNIKSMEYIIYYKSSWLDILKKYNVYEDFYNMLKEKFLYFCDTNKSKSVAKFVVENDLSFLKDKIATQQFRQDCGLTKNKYTDDDLKENLFNLKDKLGHFSLFNEFKEISPITLQAYKDHLKLDSRAYDDILKKYLTENEFDGYLKLKSEHKTNVGKQTCNMNKILISEEDLGNELIIVFNNFKQEYSVYPPRRIFNKISKYDDSTYRRKFNMNWTDICQKFGYNIENKMTGEYIFLFRLDKILNEKAKDKKSGIG